MISMTQTALAEAAGVSLSTVVDFERERRAVAEPSIAALRAALEAAGVEFTTGGQPGVRLTRDV